MKNKLPYLRTPTSLSSSSLHEMEENPCLFYLKRLGPKEDAPVDDQQFPGAVGCAFDAYVKAYLARMYGIKCPPLKQMIKDTVTTKDRRAEALDLGRILLAGYVECGALASFVAEKPLHLEHHADMVFVPGTKVPIKGHLDATLRGPKGRAIVIHDWKTTGANRPGEVSPTAGYAYAWDTDTPGERLQPHKRNGEPLEAFDEKWATQVTIYGWLMGGRVAKREVSIDQLVVGKEGRVRVACFRTHVTTSFQEKVRERLVSAWQKIQTETVVPEELALGGLEVLKTYG